MSLLSKADDWKEGTAHDHTVVYRLVNGLVAYLLSLSRTWNPCLAAPVTLEKEVEADRIISQDGYAESNMHAVSHSTNAAKER